MVEVEILEVPYFCYDDYHWAELKLDSDPLEILAKIKEGENLFRVIPGFNKGILHFHPEKSFPYGRFEKRREIHVGKEIFRSNKKPVQIGKLLVPHYNVYLKRDIEKNDSYMRSKDALIEFPNTLQFYSWGVGSWKPVDEKIFIINKNQLE